MANSLLTDDIILKEALSVLHQKLNFIPNIGLQYDNSFAKTGAKIGSSLRIRMPNEYTVRSGAVMSVNDTTERSETLTVGTQKGVDMKFSSVERTMDLDSFSSLHIAPAMSVLAAVIEADALTMRNDVWNFIDGVDSDNNHSNIQKARAELTKNLAPESQRCMIHTPDSVTGVIASAATYFHDAKAVSRQYREGMLGRQGGFDHYENTLIADHTTGTAGEGDSGYNVNGAQSADATAIANGYQTLTVNAGSTTFAAGDVITIAGVYRVHPETKTATSDLQKFVVRAAAGPTATSLSIQPAIITSGARQNVSAAAANGAAVNKVGGGASADWQESLAFHKDAFAIAFADLEMLDGVKGSRQVLDGISMRIQSGADLVNDQNLTRLDVYYGYKTVRPQLAVRVGHN